MWTRQNAIVLRSGLRIHGVPASVRRAIELQRRGLVEANERVKAAAYVAHIGLTLTAQLSSEEAVLIQQCPLAEPRMKAIVDQFALLASSEVIGMGA